MKLSPLSFQVQTGVIPTIANSLRCKALARHLDDGKQWFLGRKLNRGFASGFSIFAGLAVVVSLGGALNTALAADGSKATIARSFQEDPLEVPGSFKDLPEARDGVTAKRSPEQIGVPAANGGVASKLAIDADKVGAPGGSSVDKVTAFAGDEGELIDFHATAYCLKGRTASGMNTRPGVIAADPRVLPLGTVVHLRAGRYTGIYTVMDTGGLIKGRIIDVYVPTYREAIQFGRQKVKIKVIAKASAKTRRDAKNLIASER